MVRSSDFNRNGADDLIDVFISFEEKTSTDLVGVGLGTVGLGATSAIGIFTSTSNPSVIQSIRLANVTDAGGKVASIIVNNGSTDRFLVENLVVPKYASIEVLDNLKRIETNDVVKIQIDEAETIDVQLSAKKNYVLRLIDYVRNKRYFWINRAVDQKLDNEWVPLNQVFNGNTRFSDGKSRTSITYSGYIMGRKSFRQ